MNLTIEIPDDVAAALKTHAGSTRRICCQVRQPRDREDSAPSIAQQGAGQPLETGRGMFAKYGPAPSEEEIDANRAELFRNFAQDS